MLAPDVSIHQVDAAGGTVVSFGGSPPSKVECQYGILWLSVQYLSLFF